jgi:hypothetical protein
MLVFENIEPRGKGGGKAPRLRRGVVYAHSAVIPVARINRPHVSI